MPKIPRFYRKASKVIHNSVLSIAILAGDSPDRSYFHNHEDVAVKSRDLSLGINVGVSTSHATHKSTTFSGIKCWEVLKSSTKLITFVPLHVIDVDDIVQLPYCVQVVMIVLYSKL